MLGSGSGISSGTIRLMYTDLVRGTLGLFLVFLFPGERSKSGARRHQLRAHIIEWCAVGEANLVLSRGVPVMDNLARFIFDTVDIEDSVNKFRRKLGTFSDQGQYQRAVADLAEVVEEEQERPEEECADTNDCEGSHTGRHAETEQKKEDCGVLGVLDRRSKPDDAGASGNPQRARYRVADDDHHHGRRHAE